MGSDCISSWSLLIFLLYSFPPKSPFTDETLCTVMIYGSFATLPVRAWFFRYLSLDHSLSGIFRSFSTLVVSLPRCFSQLSVN